MLDCWSGCFEASAICDDPWRNQSRLRKRGKGAQLMREGDHQPFRWRMSGHGKARRTRHRRTVPLSALFQRSKWTPQAQDSISVSPGWCLDVRLSGTKARIDTDARVQSKRKHSNPGVDDAAWGASGFLPAFVGLRVRGDGSELVS